jgi:hypothetical protein
VSEAGQAGPWDGRDSRGGSRNPEPRLNHDSGLSLSDSFGSPPFWRTSQMDTHDDRKSAKAVNTAMVSAGLELTDDELAKIAGGLNPQPLPPSPPHPERVT